MYSKIGAHHRRAYICNLEYVNTKADCAMRSTERLEGVVFALIRRCQCLVNGVFTLFVPIVFHCELGTFRVVSARVCVSSMP